MDVLIVEGERVTRDSVRAVLETYPEVAHISECTDGAEAVEHIRDAAPDVVFVGVQLRELNGVEVIRAIGPAQIPAVVFIAADDQYAVQAFDVEALDYLVKPFDDERLRVAFDRARRKLLASSHTRREPPGTLLAGAGAPVLVDRVSVRTDGRTVVVRVDEIDWIEAAGNYIQIHIARRAHLVRRQMSLIEAKLDSRRFWRVHRSAIVNLDRVVEIRPGARGDVVVLRDGTTVPLSETRRGLLVQRLGPTL